MLVCDRCKKNEKELGEKPVKSIVLLQVVDQFGSRHTGKEIIVEFCGACREKVFAYITDYVRDYANPPEPEREEKRRGWL